MHCPCYAGCPDESIDTGCAIWTNVYELKERLATIVDARSLTDPQWKSWKTAAASASSIDLRPVIDLVESRWDELIAYQAVIGMIFFEQWFERATSNLELHGGHSFAAARAAFLEQNKTQPGATLALWRLGECAHCELSQCPTIPAGILNENVHLPSRPDRYWEGASSGYRNRADLR